jgi:small subunit ribosomal protein S21
MLNFAPLNVDFNQKKQTKYTNKMIIVQVKEGENIERALKKFKRKYEKTGIVKELRARQAFQKPSVTNRKKMMKAVYVQKLRSVEE